MSTTLSSRFFPVLALALAGALALHAQAPDDLPLATLPDVGAGPALIIAVDKYGGNSAFDDLPGIEHDWKGVKATLLKLGYQEKDITVAVNPTQEEMVGAMNRFGELASATRRASFFYFSGHGVLRDGKNYLIPARAPIRVQGQLSAFAVPIEQLLGYLGGEDCGPALVFVDACRNNTLPRTTKSATSPVMLQRQPGLFIGYATGEGRESNASLEGSVFTTSLCRRLLTPGRSVDDVYAGVIHDVQKATEGEKVPQDPQKQSALRFVFHLVPAGTLATVKPGMSEAEVQRRIAAALEEERAKARGAAVMPPPVAPVAPPLPSTTSTLSPSSAPAVSTTTTPKAGATMEIALPGGEKMTFCYCPAGSFTMGSPASEKKRREVETQVSVRLSKGYWMAKTECTQGQWQAVMGSNPSKFSGSKDLPVEQVSWEEAQAFIAKLNALASLPPGFKLALPTEAQWEYACQAGKETVFAFGDTLTSVQANFDGNYPYGSTKKGVYLGKTAKAGSYAANAWGLQDMHGNVFEWCLDAWDGDAKHLGGTNPVGMSGSYRVVRGGAWGSLGQYCRSANRDRDVPGDRGDYLGFRLAAVPAGP